jgi:hypothetical protein
MWSSPITRFKILLSELQFVFHILGSCVAVLSFVGRYGNILKTQKLKADEFIIPLEKGNSLHHNTTSNQLMLLQH